MIGKPMGLQEEAGVFGRLAPKIGFVAVLGLAVWAMIPLQARAQVNIDQGKSSADIFANDCAVCHKSTRGLANGQNSLALSSFLHEHYTASKEQANALAAYVLANGGGSGTPQKPVAASEPKSSEPKGTKSSEPKSSEAKPSEPKAAGAKPAAHPTRAAARGEEEASPNAKQQRPADEHEVQPVTASRTTKPESEPTPPGQQPAAIGAVPAANEAPGAASAPSPEAPTTSAAAPSELQPGDNATVPRDDIPD